LWSGVNSFAGGSQFIKVVGFAEYPVMGGQESLYDYPRSLSIPGRYLGFPAA
jgi:hypothetical protein